MNPRGRSPSPERVASEKAIRRYLIEEVDLSTAEMWARALREGVLTPSRNTFAKCVSRVRKRLGCALPGRPRMGQEPRDPHGPRVATQANRTAFTTERDVWCYLADGLEEDHVEETARLIRAQIVHRLRRQDGEVTDDEKPQTPLDYVECLEGVDRQTQGRILSAATGLAGARGWTEDQIKSDREATEEAAA